MSREILYRVWIPYSKIMMAPKTIQQLHEERLSGVTIGQVKEWVYLQYIGSEDIQGVKLFDGDIMITPEGNRILLFFGTKEYEFDYNIIECTGWLAKKIGGRNDGQIETFDSSMIGGKVIGNAYQHPELLTP